MIKIHTGDGIVEIEAEIEGFFAVHEDYCYPGYTVTHLPSGLSIGFCFSSIEAAREAARKIQRLRNDWINLEDTHALKDAIYAICKDGKRTNGHTKPAEPALNGFGAER